MHGDSNNGDELMLKDTGTLGYDSGLRLSLPLSPLNPCAFRDQHHRNLAPLYMFGVDEAATGYTSICSMRHSGS